MKEMREIILTVEGKKQLENRLKELNNVLIPEVIERIAAANEIPQIARIPIDPDFANQVDKGLIELYEGDWLDNMTDAIEAL